jgi:hypothetical protein
MSVCAPDILRKLQSALPVEPKDSQKKVEENWKSAGSMSLNPVWLDKGELTLQST